MQKESCKNIEPFPSSNFLNNQGFKNGRGPPRPFGWSAMLDKFFKNSLDQYQLNAKRIKPFPRSIFLSKMGVALPRPFGCSAMLDKIIKNSLD